MVLMLIVWAAVAFLLGLCLIIVVPWTSAKMAGQYWVERVSDRYIWLAQTAARRSALIIRDGDVKLVPKRYDSDLKGDKDTQSGDKRHHHDEFDILGRLKDKVFGFGLTSRDTYISPLLAELGEEGIRAKERQEIGPEETKGTSDKFKDGILIPKTSRLVDLSAARHLTTGQSEPESGHESYKKTRISQEKFHDRVSFGQGMLIILAAIGSMGAAWFAASRGGGTSDTGTTVSLLTLLAIPGLDSIDWDAVGRKLLVLAWITLWVVGIPVIAALTYGPLIAVLVTVVMLATAFGIVGFIALMGPSLPVFIGMMLAKGFWILAQLTVGSGVIVERSSGELEHRQLRKAGDDVSTEYVTNLSDGKQLPIEGSKGDLIRFAWAPIGFAAEKSDENMETISEEIPMQAATDGGTIMPKGKRMDYDPEIKVPDDDEWLVTLPQLWTRCESTCESHAVRQGRQKALTEHGGEQQISMLVFFGMLLGAIVIGGTFGLIAGGAIL